MHRDDLARWLDDFLGISRFRDYSPNGLQVEGRSEVRRIVTGVTASAALIDAAVDAGADAILVHHGYFWRGEDSRLIGPRRARIAKLLRADVNLFAFHLPLDAHPEVGNNAQLGRRLGFIDRGRTGEQDLIAHGLLERPVELGTLGRHIAVVLGREPLVIGAPERRIDRVAWCTGGAQGYFENAIAIGVDAFITGEVSEQQYHLALESGVAFIAAGHHATERFGIQALGAHVAATHALGHQFIDIPNPV